MAVKLYNTILTNGLDKFANLAPRNILKHLNINFKSNALVNDSSNTSSKNLLKNRTLIK